MAQVQEESTEKSTAKKTSSPAASEQGGAVSLAAKANLALFVRDYGGTVEL